MPRIRMRKIFQNVLLPGRERVSYKMVPDGKCKVHVGHFVAGKPLAWTGDTVARRGCAPEMAFEDAEDALDFVVVAVYGRLEFLLVIVGEPRIGNLALGILQEF